MTEIGLAAAIEELRRELYAAQDAGAGQQFAFEIDEAQLELLLEVRGEGRLSFGVATLGGGGTASQARTHKLTLKLKVKDRAIAGERAEIGRRESGSWDGD
ncbi:trypco2 family protein [Streptomyces sp. NPDC001185]|uniref:trypco2 family protein n=1 Tax=Streptomyces sp. NPDC001185 TaxID=3154380 RepID=UPI0033200DBD